MQFQNKLNQWDRDLDVIKAQLTKLNLTNIMEGLDALQSQIEEVRVQLKNEQRDKLYFEQNNDEIYAKVIDIEKVFLKICSLLPEIYKTYIVSNEQTEKSKH